MNYDLTDHIALTYIAGYSKISGGGDSDADAGALPPTLNPDGTTNFIQSAFGENRTVSSSYEFYSHELQLKSTGHNAIDWIVGGYYSHETNKIRFDVEHRYPLEQVAKAHEELAGRKTTGATVLLP